MPEPCLTWAYIGGAMWTWTTDLFLISQSSGNTIPALTCVFCPSAYAVVRAVGRSVATSSATSAERVTSARPSVARVRASPR